MVLKYRIIWFAVALVVVVVVVVAVVVVVVVVVVVAVVVASKEVVFVHRQGDAEGDISICCK